MSISGNWDRRFSRRSFLGITGLSAAALALGSRGALAQQGPGGSAGFGEVVADSGGILDLPEGFQYRIISAESSLLSNPSGESVPGDHDGMAAFPGPDNSTILVRNHELDMREGVSGPPVPTVNPYDKEAVGGTTGIVVGPDCKEVRDFVTSSGTKTNCAGGPTPWGTWLTCEETREDNHGFVFEVNPNDPNNDLSKTPIRDMGFFSHEANGTDPETSTVYLTEDDFRGDIPPDPTNEVPKPASEGGSRTSFLYRYLPNDTSQKPGALQKGGRLQALAIEERPENPNTDLFDQGQEFKVVWKDVNPEEAHAEALAKGCARFNRLEGADFKDGVFWFADTAGGEERLGQIYRYRPATETLELFFEGQSANNMQKPDNIVVAPFGDLWFCEDGEEGDRVMGITPGGEVYTFAKNRLTVSEFAGCTFSPDGSTFFVNIQNPGLTFAIWGPFPVMPDTGGVPYKDVSGRHSGGHKIGAADPPAGLGPKIPGKLAEAAERFGMSPYEAAAYDRLGVPLT